MSFSKLLYPFRKYDNLNFNYVIFLKKDRIFLININLFNIMKEKMENTMTK